MNDCDAATVTTGYKIFLTNLALPLPDREDLKKAKDARDDYEDALDDLEEALGDYQYKWDDFNQRQQTLPPDRQVSFDVWYQRTWARRIASREDAVRLAFQTYSYWVRKASGGYEALADAIEAFNNDGFQPETITPSQAKVKLRRFEITPSLDTFINNSRSLPADAPPAWSFTLNKSSFRYSFEETRWRGGAIYLGGFIGYAGASGGRTSIDTSSDSFSLEFSARNIQVFTITPGEWFTGSIVSAFKNGPWIPEGPVATGSVKLWGTEGILRLLSTQVVVVYQPKMKVSLSQSEFESVRTNFQAAGGFSIGPFGFGGSYNRNTADVSFDASSNTITAQDSTDTPQILAVLSLALPDFT